MAAPQTKLGTLHGLPPRVPTAHSPLPERDTPRDDDDCNSAKNKATPLHGPPRRVVYHLRDIKNIKLVFSLWKRQSSEGRQESSVMTCTETDGGKAEVDDSSYEDCWGVSGRKAQWWQ
ncbi:hypothetical protein NDU88_001691 [Pleurodeles waltl]|uniref:Uncharacterized protein n=1 Tax=Pleurodeles waltl TaxID=8319 RepID=A0AAV7U745_PLEWA|nr:hypothetical protein NDU88_001691 [Pleurodeles waltl]